VAKVIWNPNAGRRRLSLAGWDSPRLHELLDRAGLNLEICRSDSADEAAAIARAEVEAGARLVVAAGGDGTFDAVADVLLDSGVAIGILPLGSVMNVPRMLGIPRDAQAAAQIIAADFRRTIDVGEANGRPFYETTAVGIGPSIFREAQRIDAGDYGGLWRAVRNAFRYRPRRMRLEMDGGRAIETRALMVTVGNGPYMGLGMTVAPGARLDDGKFDVTVFRHFSKIELFTHLAAIAFGRRRLSAHVTTRRSSYVRIDARRPLPARADAMEVGYTPVECRVRRAALTVIVPELPVDRT
jgi:YegS/Rv2252/BmrU family lipid kinase